MLGMEIALLVIGCVFMVGSFFVSEKLSGTEINRIAELSDNELKRIISKGMQNAENQIDEVVGAKVEEVAEKVEIALERESNMKIMAIEEYSDTVINNIKKTHDENMFLYSMLNDKHTELTSMTGNLQRLAANIRNMNETISEPIRPEKEQKSEKKYKAVKSREVPMNASYLETAAAANAAYEDRIILENEERMELLGESINHNDRILELHKEGLSKVEIAKRLNLGVGEVSLVIGLYKGDGK